MFQFPSNGKAYPKYHTQSKREWAIKFQFPSNGKAYPKGGMFSPSSHPISQVSIPFKRESVSKAPTTTIVWKKPTLVSIPFKRESVSKEDLLYCWQSFCQFQFPSNGKAYPKTAFAHPALQNPLMFQFPSNGKAYPKAINNTGYLFTHKEVSIPFKRESVSKVLVTNSP